MKGGQQGQARCRTRDTDGTPVVTGQISRVGARKVREPVSAIAGFGVKVNTTGGEKDHR